MNISTSFPYRIPEDISTWKFPLYFPQNFKMRYNDIRRVPVVRKYPSDDLRSFVIEFKMFTVLGILPSHFNLDLKNPLNFPVDSHFTYNPSFRVGSLHQPQGFPTESAWFCPLGWKCLFSSENISQKTEHIFNHLYNVVAKCSLWQSLTTDYLIFGVVLN